MSLVLEERPSRKKRLTKGGLLVGGGAIGGIKLARNKTAQAMAGGVKRAAQAGYMAGSVVPKGPKKGRVLARSKAGRVLRRSKGTKAVTMPKLGPTAEAGAKAARGAVSTSRPLVQRATGGAGAVASALGHTAGRAAKSKWGMKALKLLKYFG